MLRCEGREETASSSRPLGLGAENPHRVAGRRELRRQEAHDSRIRGAVLGDRVGGAYRPKGYDAATNGREATKTRPDALSLERRFIHYGRWYMADDITKEVDDKMQKTLRSLEDEFNTIRTGRASSALFEKIKVDYYGNPTPLNQLATISVPEARLVVIQPWDKSAINEIEKAIQKSELSLNPSNDGKVIRINIPPLTEERRKDYVKLAKNMADQARVAVRNVRRDAKDDLKKQQKNGDISEDEQKRLEDDIQSLTDRHISEINDLLEAKEKEILEV